MHRRAFTGSLISLLAAAPAMAQSGSAPTIPEEALIQPVVLKPCRKTMAVSPALSATAAAQMVRRSGVIAPATFR